MHFNVTDETMSVWKLTAPGTHAKIAKALDGDAEVQQAIQAKLDDPDNGDKRAHLIDLIARRTGNCIGQVASNQPLNPGSDVLSIYRALKAGTEAAITEALGGSADTHAALATKDRFVIVRKISRMTGNCVGQAAVAQGVNILGPLL